MPPKIELFFSSCKTIFANNSPTLYLYQSKQQINVFLQKKCSDSSSFSSRWHTDIKKLRKRQQVAQIVFLVFTLMSTITILSLRFSIHECEIKLSSWECFSKLSALFLHFFNSTSVILRYVHLSLLFAQYVSGLKNKVLDCR